MVRHGRTLPALVEAFRTGDAPPPLSWEPEGRAEFNRALFLNLMDTDWLPTIPDRDRRLRAEPPARVADVACGTGWSSIAMASAYPKIAVDGFDLDEDSIAAARRNAHDAGLGDRVTFSVSDASDSATVDRYDLVTTLIAGFPKDAPGPPILPPQDGFLFLDREKFHDSFAADVDAELAAFIADSQVPWGVDALGGTISEAAWRSKPSWYLVATDDRMIPPPAQREMSGRAGSTVEEAAASHSIYVSQPAAVAELVKKAASEVRSLAA
jgi:SAM-dependent methyltransferase